MKKFINIMKKSKRKRTILISSIGLLFGIISIILGFSIQDQRYASALLGLGAGISAPSFFYLIAYVCFSNSEIKKLEERKQIERNDERNIKIRQQTGYICYEIIFYCLILAGLILVFTNNVNTVVSWIMISLIVIHSILKLIVGCYYSKKM